MQGFKGFRGRCYLCGNFGHKQTKCPYKNTKGNQKANNHNNYRKQNNQKEATLNSINYNLNNYVPPRRDRFDGKCDHCRKWDHRKEDRWILKKLLLEKQELIKQMSCTQPYQTSMQKTKWH